MFLAWGLTAVTLYFTRPREKSPTSSMASASNVTFAGASPVSLVIVAFATLSLPKELQKAGALVPALQSNWLMMHVSVVMCSYSTLMFGSVLCAAILALEAKEGPIAKVWEAALPAFRGIVDNLAPAPQPVLANTNTAMSMKMD